MSELMPGPYDSLPLKKQPNPEYQLQIFKRQYLQLIHGNGLAWPSGHWLKDLTFQSTLYHSIFKPQNVPFEPPSFHTMRVLKELIQRIEKSITDPEEEEVSEDLLLLLSSLMARPLRGGTASPVYNTVKLAQSEYFVTYTVPGPTIDETPRSFTLTESPNIIASSGTTGHRTWEASLHLGAWLTSSLKEQSLITGRRILELGSGTGFLLVLCSKILHAAEILATDGDHALIDQARENLFLNRVPLGAEVNVQAFRWGNELDTVLEDSGQKQWDIVLGADLVYDDAIIPPLVVTMMDLFDRFPEIVIVFAITLRKEETFRMFLDVCTARRFKIKDEGYQSLPVEEQTGFFRPISPQTRILSISRQLSSISAISDQGQDVR